MFHSIKGFNNYPYGLCPSSDYVDGLTLVGDVLVVKLAIVVQAMRDEFIYRRVIQRFIQFF